MAAGGKKPRFGRYVIEAEIGRGAMGVVYKANDPTLGRTVAIKTINIALERSDLQTYEARFQLEARAAGSLNHPNIVTIYDIGRSGELAYMAMEFLEGVELRQLLAAGEPLSVAQAVAIAAQVADGLGYAHLHGIVHRDIKPANIMVAPERPVKITDFGIARMRASRDLTQTGTALGSPKYMSPEQALGKRADARSDIFSLGVVLYEMLAGHLPFAGDSASELMAAIVNRVPPAPGTLRREVPQLLDHIVAKMLAKQLDERYQHAAEVARDLRQCALQIAGAGAAGPPAAPIPAPPAAGREARDTLQVERRDRTRQEDAGAGLPNEFPAAQLSQSFDSLEATQRLEALDAAQAAEPGTATQALARLAPARAPGWRLRDWLAVGGAAVLGLAAALAMLQG